MAKRGNILYTDRDFTDLEVQQQFGFPVILILHDNNSVIKKISAFDENGAKSIYDFTLAASKDFVTATIATAISNIKDNTLEFPAFADFPQPGEVGNVYIDLEEDVLYIWDSASNSYISQSWNQTIITGIQSQVSYINFQISMIAGQLAQTTYPFIPYEHITGNYKNTDISYDDINNRYGIGKLNPTEKLDIAGRTKSDGQVFNETTSAILPREIKFKSGNFVAAGNDGVEKKLLREGDAITLPTPFKYGYGNGNITSNNIFGIDALNSNTTGANNAAFGRSLVLNTTGSNNSAFGSYACLYYNTTGNSNCAFGYSALMNNSTASYNTAFGAESLLNSNANYNSAFGYQSLRSNTSGTSNMAVGAFALMNNSTGSNNTAYGQGSLSKNTTASTNTAIGTASASELTTGGSNVCIGAWAGAYLPSMSSASSYSNCTYLGEFSKASANGVTNEIAIGKDSKGQGSNTATIGNENTDTLHLLKNGAGIVLISPDGTKKVKISIDNSGNLITTLIA